MPTPPPDNPAPRDLTIGPLVGRGRRCDVYAGNWNGKSVVVKSYRQEAIRKYRRRFGVSIAQFEHDRNSAFFACDELRPHVARPITVVQSGHDDEETRELFVQQRVEGTILRNLLDGTGRLPGDILQSIDAVVSIASGNALYDIDMSPSNFLMQRDGDGWRPVLFDFNLMPQHLHAPNPFVALLYRTGLRHPAHRDRGMLRRLRTWPK